MSRSKEARAQLKLVQAFKLRQLSERILRQAKALEAEAAPVLAAWDDAPVSRDEIGESEDYETLESPVNPKDEDELLDLIEDQGPAISDSEDLPKTKQNKGNNPYPKKKDKWQSEASLRRKVARSR